MKTIKHRTLDIIIILIITVTISILLISIDAFELFSDFAEEHEEYELDELVLILLVGSFCTIWYSIRRYNENKKLQIQVELMNKKLNAENLNKDKLIIEQSKMASLGEMLNNISHQWRQPLSIISTSASGLQFKKTIKPLTDNEIDSTLEHIIDNANYLSETIDNFRSFIKNENNHLLFNLESNIHKSLTILEASLNTSNITCILDLKSSIEIDNQPNELTQVFVNLINNSKDAFTINNIQDRYIFISSEINDSEVTIKIKDTANGIPADILDKVFEPYFTTKHQSQGTGLGLYIAFTLITERMRGKLSVKNVTSEYKNKKLKGCEFSIVLPRIF